MNQQLIQIGDCIFDADNVDLCTWERDTIHVFLKGRKVSLAIGGDQGKILWEHLKLHSYQLKEEEVFSQVQKAEETDFKILPKYFLSNSSEE